MVKRLPRRKYSDQVYEEACEWFVEFRTGEPAESARRAFHAWLQEAPAHMAAYLDVAESWNQSLSLDLGARFPKEMLFRQAAADPPNVLKHPGSVASSKPRAMTSSRRAIGWLVAAGLVATLAGGAFFALMRAAPTYSTAIGEQRSVLLADGSTVNLNSRSRLRIRFSTHEREVDLIAGQALFSVTKDAARPFLVHTGSTLVRAVGTEFDVYRRNNDTIVTVVEGRVSVAATHRTSPVAAADVPGEAVPSVLVFAGEQLKVSAVGDLRPIQVNVSNATAWTQRELVFASTPLREVAEEFNRYNVRQLVIADPALARFQIDGVFSSTDPTSLINFLRDRYEIQVTQTDSQIRISHR